MLIRLARPEDREAPALIYHSAKALFDRVFRAHGVDPVRLIMADFRRGTGLFGHRSTWVAELDGKIVGTLTWYPGVRYRSLRRATLFSSLRYIGRYSGIRKIWPVFKASLSIAPLFKRPDRAGAYIANACVVPDQRRAGLYSELFRTVEAAARKRNLSFIECDVSSENSRALAVHSRLAFYAPSGSVPEGNEVQSLVAARFAGWRRLRKDLVDPKPRY